MIVTPNHNAVTFKNVKQGGLRAQPYAKAHILSVNGVFVFRL